MTYDYRMGTVTKAGGQNVSAATFQSFGCTQANKDLEVTCAQYDEFNRLMRLVRPGDTFGDTTLSIVYYDTVTSPKPIRYLVQQRVTTTSGDSLAETQVFYDGFGQMVQEKRESQSFSTQNTITDFDYDGLERLKVQSQPRDVAESGSAFLSYTAPSGGFFRPTTTTYDALDRVVSVQLPDISIPPTQTFYQYSGFGIQVQKADANGHRTIFDYDMLGRLRKVHEWFGNGGSEGAYSPYSQTTYSYDAMDRLIGVADALSNQTTILYDSLGRKVGMTDPDMGSWSYQYSPQGVLSAQTDARNTTTTLYYDALDRLASKWYSNGEPAPHYYYGEAGVPNGKGRRTATCTWTGSAYQVYQRWEYDGRGRATFAGQLTNGVSLHTRSTYDSADRLATLTYEPTNEVVTYGYDIRGRAATLTSSLGGVSVTNATYTALDQPLTRTYGGSHTTSWQYNSPLARLTRMTLPGALDRGYTYDGVGNVKTIPNYLASQTLNFSYDHRDRLTQAWTTSGAAQAPANLSQWQARGPAPAAGVPQAARQLREGPTAPAITFDESGLMAGAGRAGMAESAGVVGAYAALPARLGAQLIGVDRPLLQVTTLVQDSFTRTVSNGWGTADTGGTYATPGSNASNYAVNGSVGQLTITSSSSNRELVLNGAGSQAAQDVEISARMATDALPTGSSAELRWTLLARQVSSGNLYRGVVRLLPDGSVKLQVQKVSGGSESWVGSSVTVSGLTVAANQYVRVRMQVSGTNPTTFKMRAWLDGTSEPSTWVLTGVTDSTSALQAAGHLGIRTHLTSEVTNAPITASWDDWLVTALGGGPTPTPTNTPTGPTNTPTNTPTGPTNTPTHTNTPTNTPAGPTSTPTNTPVPGANLLTNGGFEAGNLSGWTLESGSMSASASSALGGSWGAQMSGTGQLVQKFTTVVGQQYQATAHLRIDQQITTPSWGGLRVQVTSNDWSVLATSADYTTANAPAGQWVTVSLAFTATETLTRLTYQNFSGGGQFNASADDFVVTLAGAPTPTPTNTPTRTNTPTNTPTGPTNTPTNTPVPPTNTPTNTPTATPVIVAPPTYNQSYGYNQIGNLTSKAGITQQYGLTSASCPGGQRTKPHGIVTAGSNSYCYDANGNMTQGGGRSYVWMAENRPSSVTTTSPSATETYVYDADGNRAVRTRGGVTTYYAFGVWEQEGAIQRKYYPFQGQTIAVREGSTVTYLHGDHLGSVSAVTNAAGQLLSMQHFDPWGQKIGSGSISQTKRNYTGQYLDDTGLLFYNARYYDPGLGRFISADTIVPGAGILTVSPNDPVAAGAWVGEGDDGPGNPQDLNRYSYVNNNPTNTIDPSGHCPKGGMQGKCGGGRRGGAVRGSSSGRNGRAGGSGVAGTPRKVPSSSVNVTAVGKTPRTNPAAVGAQAGATRNSGTPSGTTAALQGQTKHKQLEQDYINKAPPDQRPFIARDKTVIDQATGKRMRADIVNHETGEIVEFKPRSWQDGGYLQSQAERQVQRYADYYNQRFGDQRELEGAPSYIGRVEYYDP